MSLPEYLEETIYDRLTLDYSNCDRPGRCCSAMEISSGTFTAQTGRLYTVTFSGQADLKANTAFQLLLLQPLNFIRSALQAFRPFDPRSGSQKYCKKLWRNPVDHVCE